MSLEEEAWRQQGTAAPSRAAPTGWDRLVRTIALLVLAAGFTAMLWVPVVLIPPWGLLLVLMALTLGVISVAGKLHVLGRRIEALENPPASEETPEPDAEEPGQP